MTLPALLILLSNTGVGSDLLPPFTLVSGAGRVMESVDVSMQPLLSATSKPSEYNHLRTTMVNACILCPSF